MAPPSTLSLPQETLEAILKCLMEPPALQGVIPSSVRENVKSASLLHPRTSLYCQAYLYRQISVHGTRTPQIWNEVFEKSPHLAALVQTVVVMKATSAWTSDMAPFMHHLTYPKITLKIAESSLNVLAEYGDIYKSVNMVVLEFCDYHDTHLRLCLRLWKRLVCLEMRSVHRRVLGTCVRPLPPSLSLSSSPPMLKRLVYSRQSGQGGLLGQGNHRAWILVSLSHLQSFEITLRELFFQDVMEIIDVARMSLQSLALNLVLPSTDNTLTLNLPLPHLQTLQLSDVSHHFPRVLQIIQSIPLTAPLLEFSLNLRVSDSSDVVFHEHVWEELVIWCKGRATVHSFRSITVTISYHQYNRYHVSGPANVLRDKISAYLADMLPEVTVALVIERPHRRE
ncbi:hypothetical protein IW261DRAFT_1559327 [Armillaria novae-zelandiae]|uniref:Uncharacterized protein n=1 Tax=Armillaria novae-zelandiae TaxID=153914 RepID=A0AA39PKD0_9AGAR|nr:hypothetical protein IW261DRAFT_1559327 [Armillaria novae-zelandiae]